MTESYQAIEVRIEQTIDAINTRKNVNKAAIAREFRVPLQRLRSRLQGKPSKIEVRELHERRLKPDQKLTLHQYLTKLNQLGLPTRLHMMKQIATIILRQDCDLDHSSSSLDLHWAKRWLQRQPDLFKVKRKPLSVARKNAHNLKVLRGHFELYNKVISEYDIQPNDQWNFDETEFRMSIARSDWIVSMNVTRRIYSKCPDNRESMTFIECINGVDSDIPPMLVVTKVQLLASFFNNDLANNIIVTTSETRYSNDWISLQWLKHFDKFSSRYQKEPWRLLLMDGHGSHHTHEFLKYCEDHNIVPLELSSHITHLLQSLDVCVFQSFKHWHSKAVNEAIQSSDEIFTKIEFLAAFNRFRTQAFKDTTIRSAWKKTELISYNPAIVLDKIRETTRSSTPPPSQSFVPLITTPRIVHELAEICAELMTSMACPPSLIQPLSKFTKGALADVRKAKLMKARLNQTTAAENARKARKREFNRVLQTGEVLYAKNARRMTKDRLKLEEERKRAREEAYEKRYLTTLQKCYKNTKTHRQMIMNKRNNMMKRWKIILKEMLNTTPMWVE